MRPWWLRALELLAVAGFTGLWVGLLARVAAATDPSTALGTFVAAAVLAALAADLGSGFVHWACDTFGGETTPALGPLLIQPFREHHRDPLAITRRGFLEVNGYNALATIPLLAWALTRPAATASLFADAFVLMTALAVLLTNQFHKWAHAGAPPAAVRRLQRLRLVLSPAVHALHHRGDGTRGFCVTTGWLNPLCDRFALFLRLEQGIRWMTRAVPPLLRARARTRTSRA